LPNPLLQSRVTAFRRITDEDEDKVLDDIGSGLLALLDNDTVVFIKKRFLRGYDEEPHHWYNLSSIIRIEPYSDGFDAEVYYEATQDEPAEVITYFYKLKDETDRWLEALASKKTKPTAESKSQAPQSTQPIVIKEREVIREIVKVRCRHCGNLYDERENRCPHCGGM
jgi:rubrerythrin